MTLWVKLVTLPKAIFLWLRFRLYIKLLQWRNKPAKILIYPDPLLKRIAEPVDFEITTRDQRVAVVRKMGATLAQTTWGMKLGISAPQIGVGQRIMIVRGVVMFNPEWNPPKKTPLNYVTEGCYSVPGKIFKVPRAPYGWAKWTNIDGKPFADKLKGIPAIVFQHELSHLNGQCCPDIGEEIKTTQ